MSMSVAVSSRAVSDRLPAALRRPGLLVPVMLAFVIGIGFVLRVHDAGVRSLWVDELFSVGLATQDLRTILMVLYGEEANMTLYYLLMAVWLKIVGGSASEIWMRLPSVVFGAGGIWAIYRLGSRLNGRATG